MIGVVPASTVAKSSPFADKKKTLPLAPAAMMSPFGAITTLFNGLARLCTDTASPADRPIISRADDLSTVRRKRHAVDVLAIALERPRWSAGERPQSNGAIP